MILGMDFLQAFSIDICNSSKTVAWNGVSTPFKPPETFDRQTSIDAMLTTLLSAENDDNLDYKSKSSASLFMNSASQETLPSNNSM
jgi:hypothetical protein